MGSGQTPALNSDSDYAGNAGLGGTGGAITGSAGNNGNPGRVVIRWGSAPTYNEAQYLSYSSGKNTSPIIINKPAGVVSGDLLIAAVSKGNNFTQTTTPPAG